MTMSVDINIEDPRSSHDIYRCLLRDIYALQRREPENRKRWEDARLLMHQCRANAFRAGHYLLPGE
jgi:CRISPR/Cas system CSM-associated protein Csm2 small subunit